MPIRFVDRRGYVGQLPGSVDGAIALLQGTHVRPAGRTGVVNAQFDGATASLIGGFTTSSNRLGSIATTLGGASSAISGTHIGGGLVDGALADISWAGTMPVVATGNLASFGGVNGPVNSAPDSVNAVSSVNLGTNYAWVAGDPQWIVPDSYNGNKSILNRYGYPSATGGSFSSSGPAIFGIRYAFPQPFMSIYYNTIWKILTATIPPAGQVKFERITGSPNVNGGLTDDAWANILVNQYGSSASFQIQSQGPGNNGGSLLPNVQFGGDGWDIGGWVRREVFIVAGSSGVSNGSIQWRVTRLSDGAILSQGSVSGRMLWGGTDPAYRAFILQGLPANAMLQDGSQIFIDSNSKAVANYSAAAFPGAVVLGNASTYAACDTRRFVMQDVQSAGSGNIRIRANKGVLPSLGSAWAYVMGGINTPLNSNGIVPTPVGG